MKKVKRISLALTLILGIYSAVAAFLVSGDKLLSMKRSLGRVLALSYRYTALTAAGVGLLTLALFLGGRSRKKRREKKAARHGEERPVEQEPAAWQLSLIHIYYTGETTYPSQDCSEDLPASFQYRYQDDGWKLVDMSF